MATLDTPTGAPPEYEYDLSATLYRPSTLYEEALADTWLLYAPDFPGLPILVDGWVRDIVDRFSGGASVGAVLGELTRSGDPSLSFERCFAAVCLLEERGFLRDLPAKLPYRPPLKPDPVRNISIWLHTNSDCNLACSYCFVETKARRVVSEKLQERLARAIAHTVRANAIKEVNLKFAGGEPTLVVPLMEKIQERVAAELDGLDTHFMTSILSNGTVLSDRLVSFLKRPSTSIGISLDGYGPVHDRYRIFRNSGKGSWHVIEKNIRTLLDHSIKPYIMTTTSAETLDSLPDLLEWIFDAGLKTRVSVVRNPNCSWSSSPEHLARYEPYCDKLSRYFEEALTRLEMSATETDFRDSLAVCELSFDYPANGVTCGIGKNHIVITTSGNVVPCPMTVHETGIELEDDLLCSCRKSFPYSPAERRCAQGEEDCLECRWYPVCVGGCPITNLRTMGWPFSKSPFCDFYKYFIPRYVRFFGSKLLQSRQRKAAEITSRTTPSASEGGIWT